MAVRIGAITVALDARRHFSDVAQVLPAPGVLEPDDPAERKHGARIFCYSYHLASGAARLEFHDSDFGLHTATTSRLTQPEDPKCPSLSSEPVFIVGETRYALSSRVLLKPPGFQSDAQPASVSFTREWKRRESDGGGCWWRSIFVKADRHRGTIQTIMVQNWEEPGC